MQSEAVTGVKSKTEGLVKPAVRVRTARSRDSDSEAEAGGTVSRACRRYW